MSIVGGGVCGLACAIALERAGVPVQLFEAAVGIAESIGSFAFLRCSFDIHSRLHSARSVQDLELVYATRPCKVDSGNSSNPFFFLGPNAVRVLRYIGLLEAVLQKCHPGDLKPRGFVYRTGMGEHEAVYTVRFLQTGAAAHHLGIDTHLYLQVPVEDPNDFGIGIHRYGARRPLLGCID